MMVVTKFSWENSCWCEKRAEGAEGDLGCLSFFQENKDVIEYLVLPQAWGVISLVFAEFWAPLAWGSIYTFAYGLINEKVLCTIVGTDSSPAPPKPRGGCGPCPHAGQVSAGFGSIKAKFGGCNTHGPSQH